MQGTEKIQPLTPLFARFDPSMFQTSRLNNIWRQRKALLLTAFTGGLILFLLLLSPTAPRRLSQRFSAPQSRLWDVSNRTLGFERIYVLNMASRSDKRDAISMSASITDIGFEWMDGVDGSLVSEKAKPPLMSDELTKDNNSLGCWRAHMNFLQHIVKENIQSALVMEDDVDWDVNIKKQLLGFARGSNYLQQSSDIATRSPYGDDWDLLWLGHCGVYHGDRSSQYYYITRDDPTVVPPELFVWGRRKPDMRHPALNAKHSRLVFNAKGGLCTTAYAVTQRGARTLLEQESLSFTPATVADRALSRLCNDDRPDGAAAKCIAPYPALFGAHAAPGPTSKDSDRRVVGEKWRKVGWTGHVVFSTRMNYKGLLGLRGTVKGLIKSQWPDKTLIPEYSGEIDLPKGEGIWIAKEDYTDD